MRYTSKHREHFLVRIRVNLHILCLDFFILQLISGYPGLWGIYDLISSYPEISGENFLDKHNKFF